MQKIILEVCCGSYEDAKEAYLGGADRIELNSALWIGGLTPTMGSLALCKEEFSFPIIAMARPRGGGFCYSNTEYKEIRRDVELMLKQGADGIAFGFLQENREISKEYTKDITELIHYYKKEAVFHRAFDCIKEKEEAVEMLIELKINRILTSGGETTAYEGKSILKKLQTCYGSQIEFLPGSGIHTNNVLELVKTTGVSQIHSSCRGWKKDPTTMGDRVSFAYSTGENESNYEVVEGKKVVELKNILERQN